MIDWKVSNKAFLLPKKHTDRTKMNKLIEIDQKMTANSEDAKNFKAPK
jgi:hypothetical protein